MSGGEDRRAAGRTVVITGASRGFGLAIARALSTWGWRLIVTARDADRLNAVREELSERTCVHSLAGDVTDASHRSALAELAREVGGVAALVNNAGTLGPSPLPALLELPIDALRRVYEANVLAPLALLQALHGELESGACVINVTSDAAVNAYAGWGAYGSSKAALEQVSAILAIENPQLRIYWLDPGDMRTDMQQAAYPGEDISDRPPAESRVPAIVTLLDGDLASGRYTAADPRLAQVRA